MSQAIPNASPPPMAAILAGGASRRFGSPKALAPLGDTTLVGRVRQVLQAAGAEVVVITANPRIARAAEAPARPDVLPGGGPLAGIHAALSWAAERGREGTLVVGCDMPLLEPSLLRRLLEFAAADPSRAAALESGGRRELEPLCAWYPVALLAEAERRVAAGELSVHRFLASAPPRRLPLSVVRRFGDPAVMLANVNTAADHRHAAGLLSVPGSPMQQANVPPVVAVVGKKNSGKTTLVVAVAAELRRRGIRVASLKHGHHAFEIDQPGRDSWRHFHEGEVEAVLMVGTGKVALVMREEGDPDPAELIRRFYAGRGYDLVLVEGYKHGDFAKVEVYRSAVHDRPVHDPDDADAARRFLAIVTDQATLRAACPVIPLDPAGPQGSHVGQVADLLERVARAGDVPSGG